MARDSSKNCSKISDYYLIAYNALETFGWTYILSLLIRHHLISSTESLYETVKWPLIIFQNAAVLEIVHAATGIVRSNPVITAFQVASRVMVVCGVLIATESPRQSLGLSLALLAWSVTEVIRYSTYTLTLLGNVPYPLKWLRYSTFLVLYPSGITGELLCIYAAQKEVGNGQLYSTAMPNKYNFNFNYQYFLIFLMFMYIPLFPQLFLHMFSQRKKVLGGSPKRE